MLVSRILGQDVDGFFSELTTHVRKKLHWADSFDTFRKALQDFLDIGTRRHEPLREAKVIDQQRNWRDYLGFMCRQLQGHTGPAAPRVFQFQRRSGQGFNCDLIGHRMSY